MLQASRYAAQAFSVVFARAVYLFCEFSSFLFADAEVFGTEGLVDDIEG